MNRNILITGANNGIGLALTQSLLEMGDRVVALDLETDNLASRVDLNLLPFRCDVTQPERDDVHAGREGTAELIRNTYPHGQVKTLLLADTNCLRETYTHVEIKIGKEIT